MNGEIRTQKSEGLVITMVDAWREILGRCIEDPKEKRRIANLLGVLSMRTLDRWAQGESTPKNAQVIRKLGKSVSTFQQELDDALRIAFPEAFIPHSAEPLFPSQSHITERGIPTEFVFRILNAYTTLSMSLQQWTIANLVLEQMIHHLDPDSIGMGVIFAQCVKNRNSLQFVDGVGNNLWDTSCLAFPDNCKVELSITRSVVTTGIPQFIQVSPGNPPGEMYLFLHYHEIRALAIYPIQRSGNSAGALLICARWEDFFSFLRRKLIHDYAELFSLAFRDQDFYKE